jgi:hypothetical protein
VTDTARLRGEARRRAASRWLAAHYPVTGDPSYDTGAALTLLGLAGRVDPADALAWVYPSREAADVYARANLACWGRGSLGTVIDPAGQVVGVTDLRGEPFAGHDAGDRSHQEGKRDGTDHQDRG